MSVSARPGGRVASGHPSSRGARLEDLDRLALVDQPHPRTAVADVLDEPLLLEPRERGPDRGPADAEHARQIGLDQMLIRLVVAR